MKQKPAFQCYQQDFLGSPDVQMMNAEEFGCYMLLILNLYNNGGSLPSDKSALKVLCRGVEISEKVYAKFYEKNGQLRHSRVDRELGKQKKFSKTQSDNAKKRWQKEDAERMPSHQIGMDSASIRQCSSSSSSTSNINTRERETRTRNEFTPAQDALNVELDWLKSELNIISLSNEWEWEKAIIRCDQEKISFQDLFRFIDSRRDRGKSGGVTANMMISDAWISSFKKPQTEKQNGKTEKPYLSAAERAGQRTEDNWAVIAELERIGNAKRAAESGRALLGDGDETDCSIDGSFPAAAA